ncbi:MAG: carbamoyltransferase [Acidobacteriota bacterium]
MTRILGISAFYHDSAAALVEDGQIVAAAQEERFSREKHDHRFPLRAIEYCLQEAGIGHKEIDYVGFYDKPLLKFERLLETYLAFAPTGLRSFLIAMPLWIKEKLHLPSLIRKGLNQQYQKGVVFAEHHESHAASAFFPSPFEEAAILTLDGVGEWATASYGTGRGNRIELDYEMRFPHSLGLLYSAFTYFCGFKVNSGEYKLMGLAPYGTPRYVDLILNEILDLKADGSFRMDLSYFNYCQGLTMTSRKMNRLLGGPPRRAESPLTGREMDIAASIQRVTEEIMLRMARHVHRETGMKNLCLAGGVALNCVGNGRILREGPFERIWVQPAAGDAGGALGVALLIWHQLLEQPRRPQPQDSQRGSLLGPSFNNREIRTFLDQAQAVYESIEENEKLAEYVADQIAGQKVVGLFQGRMEFGPRALGNRSILGDARSAKMQSVINLKIKFRESFRPFAPSVMLDQVAEYFDIPPHQESPYMLLVTPIRESKRKRTNTRSGELKGLDKLQLERSALPSITHVDYSARVQTVDRHRYGRYYQILEKFSQKTGCPVIINTSFNVRGEPIVCTPADAYRCFLATGMDTLVLENFVLRKSEQKKTAQEDSPEPYLSRFELD